MIGPPLSPVPDPTLVTVPPLLASLLHTHALPFQRAIWLFAHAVVGNRFVAARLIVPMPVIGPPVRPRPVPTASTRMLPSRFTNAAIWLRVTASLGQYSRWFASMTAQPSVIPFCAAHVM